VRLLLDSHTLLWAAFSSPALSRLARDAIADPNNAKFVSPISIFELEHKRAAGKLPFPAPRSWERALASAGFALLPITASAAALAPALPNHHKDPWDRLLIAQAMGDDLAVVTRDKAFAAYGVPTLW
jgi:PIN domain nuclease of toxin-antitoxin system